MTPALRQNQTYSNPNPRPTLSEPEPQPQPAPDPSPSPSPNQGRAAWAGERASLCARLLLLGEQHDAPRGTAAVGGGTAAGAIGGAAGADGKAAMAGGGAEVAGVLAARLTPSQDEAAVASLRVAMLAAAQGGVPQCHYEPSCASTEASC